MTMRDRNGGVAAVERALAILTAFREGDASLSLTDLSERTGFYKSTVSRLLTSLERYRCVVRLEDGRYQLGPTVFRLGTLYQRSLRLEQHVVPVLRRLAGETGESAAFYTREGSARVCLFRVDSSRSVRDHVSAGDVLPLDRGAAGKVLTTFHDGPAPARSGRRSSASAPGFIITTFGERDPDTAAIAAPVFGEHGALRGALSVSGPVVRFDPAAVARVGQLVLKAAAELTTLLGGDATALSIPRRS